MRQVRPLPRGHQADAGDPQPHLRGPGRGGRRRAADRAGRDDQGDVAVRPGPDGPQPRALHDPPLRLRVRRAHPRQAVPRGRLPGAGPRPVPERLPGQRGHSRLRRRWWPRSATPRPCACTASATRSPPSAPASASTPARTSAGGRRSTPRSRSAASSGSWPTRKSRSNCPRSARTSRTPSARSRSSARARRACRAPTSSPGSATGPRSSRPSRGPAACWSRPFPPTGCPARSSPAKSA